MFTFAIWQALPPEPPEPPEPSEPPEPPEPPEPFLLISSGFTADLLAVVLGTFGMS